MVVLSYFLQTCMSYVPLMLHNGNSTHVIFLMNFDEYCFGLFKLLTESLLWFCTKMFLYSSEAAFFHPLFLFYFCQKRCTNVPTNSFGAFRLHYLYVLVHISLKTTWGSYLFFLSFDLDTRRHMEISIDDDPTSEGNAEHGDFFKGKVTKHKTKTFFSRNT